jgi:hypothetical protein
MTADILEFSEYLENTSQEEVLKLVQQKGEKFAFCWLTDFVWHGQLQALRWCINQKSEPRDRDDLVRSIMGYACWVGSEKAKTVVEMLFKEFDVDPNGKTHSDQSYYNAACRNGPSPVTMCVVEQLKAKNPSRDMSYLTGSWVDSLVC